MAQMKKVNVTPEQMEQILKAVGAVKVGEAPDMNYLGKMVNSPIPLQKEMIEEAKPAVYFDGYNVYTVDGVFTVPSNVYNMFTEISDDILERTFDQKPYGAMHRDIAYAADTTIYNAVVGNFEVTLYNIANVFIDRMNDLVAVDGKHDYFSYSHQFYGGVLMAGNIIEYINRGTYADFESLATNYVIAEVNARCVNLYNDVRTQLVDLLSNCPMTAEGVDGNTHHIREFYADFDRLFALMMKDITFECGVFLQNLLKVANMLFTRKELATIGFEESLKDGMPSFPPMIKEIDGDIHF